MTDFNINGRTKVKTLKKNFNDAFGSTLRVYRGKSTQNADDESTLAEIRAERGEMSFEVRGNMKVSRFEEKFLDEAGILVRVYPPNGENEGRQAILELTLTQSGKFGIDDEEQDQKPVAKKVEKSSSNSEFTFPPDAAPKAVIDGVVYDPKFIDVFKGKNSAFNFLGSKASDIIKAELQQNKEEYTKGYAIIIAPKTWNNCNLYINLSSTWECWWIGIVKRESDDKKWGKAVMEIAKNLSIKVEDNNDWTPIARYLNPNSMQEVKKKGWSNEQLAAYIKKTADTFFHEMNLYKPQFEENGFEL